MSREERENARREAEEILLSFLPEENAARGSLAAAVRYSVLAGGKRLRPILMIAAYRLFGGTGDVIRPFAAAMEMIHTHSLVHDDLPALDDDLFRRGKKTTHAVFGEAIGVLAGDALLNLAYLTMLRAFRYDEDPSRLRRAAMILADKTGLSGMLGGQGLDVENEKNGTPVRDEEELLYIYEYKTSALLEASLMIGAVLAGAADEQILRMETIGKKVGLAFQIRDDLLDVTATAEEIGKPVFSDERHQKTTYVTLHGIPEAEDTVRRLTEEALKELRSLPGDIRFLEEWILGLAERRN